MKLFMNPRLSRIAVFCAFFLISLFFCLALLYLGHLEIKRNEAYNIQYKSYTDALYLLRSDLNNASSSIQNMASDPTEILAADLELKIRDLRRAVSNFDAGYLAHDASDPVISKEFLDNARILHEAAFDLMAELQDHSVKDESIYRQVLKRAFDLSAALGDQIQALMSAKNQELARRQLDNRAFFRRLQIIVLAFFLATILFSLLGNLVFGRLLRRSLYALSEGTKELRGGNLEFRFKAIPPDEIGHVMYDFNLMARRIEMQSDELKKANTELRTQAEKLIEAHQHKDRFLSNMSHELRTPLNSIIGFSELIEQRAERLQPEKLKSYSSRILTAAEHLLGLITSLLDLAKSGAGTLKPVFSNFDLSFAVLEMTEMLRPLADKKNLSLELALPSGPVPVYADPRMIKQIYINLLSNAIKFTLEGGVKVRLRHTGKQYLLEVQDSGIGIPKEEHANIFKDFHRVDNGPKYAIEGVGIGLALSRRLAALHGGVISFRSEAGKGSTFTLKLPESKVAPHPETPPASAIPEPTNPASSAVLTERR